MSDDANVNDLDVVIVFLPDGGEQLQRLRESRTPRIVVVGQDAKPPAPPDELEEWVRFPADAADLLSRLIELETRLARDFRPVPTLDAEDTLHVGRRFINLPRRDAQLLKPMVEHFDTVVSRETLLAALPDDARLVDLINYIGRLRKRVSPLGLVIASVRSAGYMLRYRLTPT